MRYDWNDIERRQQERWEREHTFRVPNPGDADFDPTRPKYFVLDMFPYPSGVGLHVGHPLGYIATDVVARYKRMRGMNVLHPMGFDAFGLPAEQFAVEHGVHPRITTEKNIANMKRQLKSLGLSYDWSREFATIEPEYYKWTQWIFLQLYHSWYDTAADKARPITELVTELEADQRAVDAGGEIVGPNTEGAQRWSELDANERRAVLDNRRLAYMGDVSVNWCPALGTVLANEEVTAEGRSERGNHPVIKRPLRQWMLRITSYAERLDADLSEVSWPESVALMQRNWIGRSQGARVGFPVVGRDATVEVFTTRPDTLFGATYMVLAPEHPLVSGLVTADRAEAVESYRQAAERKSDIERQAEAAKGEKTGAFTGAYAVNPTTRQEIPIWVADYVLMGYGTGAIMAVPGHDNRDFEFAKQFELPIKAVVCNDKWLAAQAEAAGWTESGTALVDRYRAAIATLPEAFTGEGTALGSTSDDLSLDGLPTADAKAAIGEWLEARGLGRRTIQYKLRDWLFSRQRYWGEPFPILHGPDGEVVPVDTSELPVELPPMDDFRPESDGDPEAPPRPPLTRAPESWRVIERDGVRYERELNTMPNWAGSCWYYLRFLDPHNRDRLVDPEIERYWMTGGDNPGVDLYIGGVEHAVLHLLYARFWHKVLFDLGHVSTSEPFGRLFNQGYILAPSYWDGREVAVPAAEVTEEGDKYFYNGEEVRRQIGKIGKSLKNSISPDDVCEKYGADTLRLYEMYLGPLEKSKLWNTQDILGVHRFLQRLWRSFFDDTTGESRLTEAEAPPAARRILHRTIKAVTDDMEELAFNTAIARMIELNNAVTKLDAMPREIAEPFVLLLSPLAPHFAEELWAHLGNEQSVTHEPWPTYDERHLLDDEVEYPIQINGKLKARMQLAADATVADVEASARANERIQELLADKTVRKVIVVPGRLVNIVTS